MKFISWKTIHIFAVFREIIFEYFDKRLAKILQIAVKDCVYAQELFAQASEMQKSVSQKAKSFGGSGDK